ncbi:hypothetical protein VOLCADRAFT_87374 [Volvox carteri f. nagariensis]|uniref:Uncharacterized protein n=1 Tax=Volvox carteri f. nagariensis TaxID=3068 RepID=D8TL66_VOLCA|nr:uncharacterized protein VOLCADRAFT_87374 [Volvox carteri f. nagariensis]EFJ51685.1 hypothetical protein VOLCADRAFT_87374 [Volvox carteri f. nagariensis]|eukprot:XP_002947095.1 hypothetical protein VOLCADRAFT_87374 [Volvox carteri f. nagariensis]
MNIFAYVHAFAVDGQTSTDAEVYAEVTELLALLSPSRRGLQAAICEAGAVPALLRLLASSAFTRPPGNSHSTSGSGVLLPAWRAPLHAADGPRPQLRRSRICRDACGDQQQERGHRAGKGKAVPAEHLNVHSANRSNCGSGKSGSSSSQEQGQCGEPEKAGAGDGPAGPSTRDPVVLSYVLRTLVNLTSNARAGAPVRQAILRDPWVPNTLLSLLHVPDDDDDVNDLTEGSAAAVAAASGPGAVRSYLPASRWHIAGLAAWLVAHLCSVPAGQLQLVQEGVVPALVRLIRHGRMAWVTAAAERAAFVRARAASAAAGPACTEADRWHEPSVTRAVKALSSGGGLVGGARGGSHRGGNAGAMAAPAAQGLRAPCISGRLMPHASSTLLYDAAAAAAAAAGDDSPRVAAMPYMIAAVQYGLMALVNITFDNSANQRAVAMSGGMLTELEALFGVLLQPGVLLPRPATAAMPYNTAGDPAVSLELGAGGGAGGVTVGGSGSGGRGDDDGGCNTPEYVDMLLRSGYLGLAKFAVWLLAHLSSSDPDLKADIAGPPYSYVPRLLEFLMLPDEDGPQQHQQSGAASTGATAAASAGVLIVRQYAAMALVNLTCGVPSTKAAVARAMDWDAMTALLRWLAEQTERATAAATGEAAAAAATACEPAAPPRVHPPAPAAAAAATTNVGPPISDLLLYTVWLLQHLSLSPFAAAVTDSRVISPLVALLEAPDGHVRLRSSATIGALCSALLPHPDATAECGPGAAGKGAAAGAGADHNPPHANQQQQQQQQPHRAAFLAAGGVQRLLAAARRERDPQLLAYGMLCLSSGVGDDVVAVTEAVRGGALGLLEGLLVSEHPACLLPAAEALQALARGACAGLRRFFGRGATSAHPAHRATAAGSTEAAEWAAAAVSSAADHVPRSLLARVVAVMLTHGDPAVRAAMNETLGALTALPGVRERYCAVFAETLRDLVNAAEVELQVIPAPGSGISSGLDLGGVARLAPHGAESKGHDGGKEAFGALRAAAGVRAVCRGRHDLCADCVR